jgi:hypothetical protein
MKKIIILLVVVILLAAGAPVTFAAEGPMAPPPEEGDIQKDPPIKKASVYKEGFDTTGAAVFGASLLGLIAVMASSDDGTAHASHHTPASHH